MTSSGEGITLTRAFCWMNKHWNCALHSRVGLSRPRCAHLPPTRFRPAPRFDRKDVRHCATRPGETHRRAVGCTTRSKPPKSDDRSGYAKGCNHWTFNRAREPKRVECVKILAPMRGISQRQLNGVKDLRHHLLKEASVDNGDNQAEFYRTWIGCQYAGSRYMNLFCSFLKFFT